MDAIMKQETTIELQITRANGTQEYIKLNPDSSEERRIIS